MVLSLPLLSCESYVFVKKTLINKKNNFSDFSWNSYFTWQHNRYWKDLWHSPICSCIIENIIGIRPLISRLSSNTRKWNLIKYFMEIDGEKIPSLIFIFFSLFKKRVDNKNDDFISIIIIALLHTKSYWLIDIIKVHFRE